jgi:putative solute:sodium symporter small subunit
MNDVSPHADGGEKALRRKAYWQANLSLLVKLLVVWFLASFVAGILLEDWLNQFTVLGVKLGFWFAQQGSIFTFVVLIFVYARRMKKLDRAFGVED